MQNFRRPGCHLVYDLMYAFYFMVAGYMVSVFLSTSPASLLTTCSPRNATTPLSRTMAQLVVKSLIQPFSSLPASSIPALEPIHYVGCGHHAPEDGIGRGLLRDLGCRLWCRYISWYQSAFMATLPMFLHSREQDYRHSRYGPDTSEYDYCAVSAHHRTGARCKNRTRDSAANTRMHGRGCAA